jgi:iron(III) transport system ATP-binding protein
MSAAIALEGVGFSRDAHEVLSDLTFRIETEQRVALLGPSGSGKTTVLRLLLGLDAPTRGSIRLAERVVSRGGQVLVPPEERCLGVVFQDLALWPHLTVWNNLAFGLQSRGVSRDEQQARIAPLLERLGLQRKARCHPGELSGGERQRVAIARALVTQPDAVLLDEPLANVDARLKRELLALFQEVFADQRSSVIYVTHDLHEAAMIGNRIVILENGRVVQDGSLDQLRAQPATDFVRAVVDAWLRSHVERGQPPGHGP